MQRISLRSVGTFAASIVLALALCAPASAVALGSGSSDDPLTGGENITQSGTYHVSANAEGLISLAPGVQAEFVGQGADSADDAISELGFEVGDGAVLTLRDIYLSNTDALGAPSVRFLGDGTLNVEGENIIDQCIDGADKFAVIQVEQPSSVTFGGSGTLCSYKDGGGACIGSSANEGAPVPCGNITFNSGTWMLKGTRMAPVVGNDMAPGTPEQPIGTVTVNGGELYIKSVSQGACIGGSKSGYACPVVINGGTVECYTDGRGAAFGPGGNWVDPDADGFAEHAGTLTVNGGSVKTVVSANAVAWGGFEGSGSAPTVSTAATFAATPVPMGILTIDTTGCSDTVTVGLDSDANYYAGLRRHRYVTNEVKNLESGSLTSGNWLSNSQASALADGSYVGSYPTVGGSSFAPDEHLYLYLPKFENDGATPARHVVTVDGAPTAYVWDEAASMFVEDAAGGPEPVDPVADVVALIYALPEPADVSVADGDAVRVARAAFDALTPDQQNQVPFAAQLRLQMAEYQLALAERAAQEQAERDAAAAAAAAALIDALPTPEAVTRLDATAVSDARDAVDALTKAQLELVSPEHLAKLAACEDALAIAQQTPVWSRLCGATALDTMASISQEGWDTADTVVIATMSGYHDALAAAPLAGTCNAPILMTRKSTLSKQTRDQMARLGASHAIIVGGPAAVSTDVDLELAGMGVTTDRVYGDNAQLTAVAIAQAVAEKAGAAPDTCIVATSKSYHDALAIAPFAYAKGIPIYLTNAKGALRDDVAAAIAQGGYGHVVVVGGTAAIPEATETQLASMGMEVRRLAGDNAIKTAASIASWCVGEQGMSADGMGVATSGGYHDALAGAALCGRGNSVLVLVNKPGTNLYGVEHFVAEHADRIAHGYVFGGTSAVPDTVQAALEAVTGS